MQIHTTMIITPLVEEEMAERESPLLIVNFERWRKGYRKSSRQD